MKEKDLGISGVYDLVVNRCDELAKKLPILMVKYFKVLHACANLDIEDESQKTATVRRAFELRHATRDLFENIGDAMWLTALIDAGISRPQIFLALSIKDRALKEFNQRSKEEDTKTLLENISLTKLTHSS